jgi:acyl-CoA synthetase (NDP forming)
MQADDDGQIRLARISRLLNPKSIAIIGASAESGAPGRALLSNISRFGFPGNVHLVSRRGGEIDGIACLRSVEELPEGVDVAALCVPRDAVLDAVTSCVRRKVGSAVIFAAGFAEIGDAGRALQQKIGEVARSGRLVLNGPNCVGFLNFTNRAPITFEAVEPAAVSQGNSVGIIAQSGALASVLRQALLAKQRPVSLVVSTGNEADLGIEDCLAWMIADKQTHAIAMFAEQLRNPTRFLALAAKARAANKPIVMLHPGSSERARESAASHTGALASDHATMAALLRYEGVSLVHSLEELLDTAELLSCFPTPPTAGAALVTNSGALCGIALDFCEQIGLEIPRPSSETLSEIGKILPPFATIDNPLDLTGQVIKEPSIITRTSDALLADPAIGSLVVSMVPGGRESAMSKVNALEPIMRARAKPMVVVAMGDESPIIPEFAATTRSYGVPFFRSPERALRAVSNITALGRARSVSGETAPDVTMPDFSFPRGAIAEHIGKQIIARLGIPVPKGELARTVNEARLAAARIGYPVVLKAQAGALAHKSDAGGVIVNIMDEQQLVAAWQTMQSALARSHPDIVLDGALVEAMAKGGFEMVVGARRDPDWGPVVLVGLGGVWIETLKDVRLVPAYASRSSIEVELGKLKGAALLRGQRGQPAADVDALTDAVVRIGALMRKYPEIQEIDVNPLLVRPRGAGVMALDALIVTA